MTDDGKFWLLCGFILVIIAWVMVFASCARQPHYTLPDGTMIELPRTPQDEQKGGVTE